MSNYVAFLTKDTDSEIIVYSGNGSSPDEAVKNFTENELLDAIADGHEPNGGEHSITVATTREPEDDFERYDMGYTWVVDELVRTEVVKVELSPGLLKGDASATE